METILTLISREQGSSDFCMHKMVCANSSFKRKKLLPLYKIGVGGISKPVDKLTCAV